MVSVLYQVSSFYSYGLSVPLHGTALWRQGRSYYKQWKLQLCPFAGEQKTISLTTGRLNTDICRTTCLRWEPFRSIYAGSSMGALKKQRGFWVLCSPFANSSIWHFVASVTAFRASNKKKMLSQVFLFYGKNWKEQVGHETCSRFWSAFPASSSCQQSKGACESQPYGNQLLFWFTDCRERNIVNSKNADMLQDLQAPSNI